MRPWNTSLFGAVFFSLSLLNLPNANGSCLSEATALLQQRDPQGYQVLKNVPDPSEINRFLNCSQPDYELSTAVHESTHLITQHLFNVRTFTMLLPDSQLHTVDYRHLFELRELASELKGDEVDHYTGTYITGGGGAQHFLWMLDELSAYTHELITMTHLADLLGPNDGASYRDGVAKFLFFVEIYLRHARTTYPDQWETIKKDSKYLDLLQTLWTLAEDAILASQPFEKLGIDSARILDQTYTKENLGELHQLFKGAGRDFISKDPRLSGI